MTGTAAPTAAAATAAPAIAARSYRTPVMITEPMVGPNWTSYKRHFPVTTLVHFRRREPTRSPTDVMRAIPQRASGMRRRGPGCARRT
ncbi:hypothetical protein GCM10009533_28540 [Saccharopolyspora spinosporotrichia]|uniref:Uncharacterized protein n=1 Tax=Saccharopolyspora erythraea TaxID=1836 RepID=A0ABP3MXG7_SACER